MTYVTLSVDLPHATRPDPPSMPQNADSIYMLFEGDLLAPLTGLSPEQRAKVTDMKVRIKTPTPRIVSAKAPDGFVMHQQVGSATLVFTLQGDAGSLAPQVARVHYQQPEAIASIRSLERLVELSHWGANLAVQDSIDLFNAGPKCVLLVELNCALSLRTDSKNVRTQAHGPVCPHRLPEGRHAPPPARDGRLVARAPAPALDAQPLLLRHRRQRLDLALPPLVVAARRDLAQGRPPEPQQEAPRAGRPRAPAAVPAPRRVELLVHGRVRPPACRVRQDALGRQEGPVRRRRAVPHARQGRRRRQRPGRGPAP